MQKSVGPSNDLQSNTLQEPNGGRGILVQWPTVVHATAYVVELHEENNASLEYFHRCLAAMETSRQIWGVQYKQSKVGPEESRESRWFGRKVFVGFIVEKHKKSKKEDATAFIFHIFFRSYSLAVRPVF